MLTWANNRFVLSKISYCPWCLKTPIGPADRRILVRALVARGEWAVVHFHGTDNWRCDFYSARFQKWHTGPGFSSFEKLLLHLANTKRR